MNKKKVFQKSMNWKLSDGNQSAASNLSFPFVPQHLSSSALRLSLFFLISFNILKNLLNIKQRNSIFRVVHLYLNRAIASRQWAISKKVFSLPYKKKIVCVYGKLNFVIFFLGRKMLWIYIIFRLDYNSWTMHE